ncbi:ribosome biogenesis protein Noc4 [Rhodofomes roseus]|uniref:Ribosome biogenesis protein Noc4 n=1 Tax=Rhodofomes roseus TaxID=34475 RepID=A0ABQ8KIS2_9APHY|nr:ribosome biogenesis protein Noc4 [Rhodofomes roseus]KAH9837858.1 ribosome biogenesis protein Noc4 [Rhodofomes roseus]
MSAPRSSLPSSSKKRKVSTNADQDEDGTLKEIKQLESQLAAAIFNNESLNKIANLVQLALNASDANHVLKAVYALYRTFVTLITKGMMNSKGAGETEETRAVRAWLSEHMNQYVECLGELLQDEESILRTSSLQILLSIQKHLSTALTTFSTNPSTSSGKPQPQFHISHFRKVVSALLTCPPSSRFTHTSSSKKQKLSGSSEGLLREDVHDTFLNTWLDVHDDIRWFFLREAGTLLSKSDAPNVPTNLLSLLEKLSTFPTDPKELNTWWVEELGAKPPSPKNKKGKGAAPQADNSDDSEVEAHEDKPAEDDDDWRKFFDDAPADLKDQKRKSARVHTLTLHQSLHSLASHRAVYTRCWLALLPKLSSVEIRERDGKRKEVGNRERASRGYALKVLNVLHRGVLPHLTRPVLVMDWVAGCVDYGGTVGLMALNALFTLMKEYNLDYPAFYTRLYTFLDRDVLHLKHRARFFRLTELFLSSTHLPAALVAAFAKRLARLSLNAPPAAVVMLIPFTYNLLKRHPACMVMIHRSVESVGPSDDPYNDKEPNPQHAHALESSLWELHSHVSHYHPVVATLASVLEEAFTRPQYAMEDFLDHTYGTMFETEANRRIKKEPVVEDTNLAPTNVTDQLWAF